MDTNQEKNEKPTSKKIKDARKEGNVVYSRDLSMFFTLVVIIGSIFILRNYVSTTLAGNYLVIFEVIGDNQFLAPSLANITLTLMVNCGKLILALIIGGAIIAGLVTVTQTGGFVIKEKPFKLDAQKFNPVSNFKQIFGKKSWVKFAFNCIKVSIMALISFLLIDRNLKDIVLMPNLSISILSYFIFIALLKIIVVLLGVYMLFSLIDFVVEHQHWYKQLMMSREELKKEDKETNGNPEIKNQRKELHRELLQDDYMADYQGSMFVLANPTHIAIGIIYMPLRWRLPLIVIKTEGAAAQNILAKAKRNGILIVREKWLARRLYEIGELNKFIPPSLVKEVAQIIGNNLEFLPKIALEIEQIKQGMIKPDGVAEISRQFERLRVNP